MMQLSTPSGNFLLSTELKSQTSNALCVPEKLRLRTLLWARTCHWHEVNEVKKKNNWTLICWHTSCECLPLTQRSEVTFKRAENQILTDSLKHNVLVSGWDESTVSLLNCAVMSLLSMCRNTNNEQQICHSLTSTTKTVQIHTSCSCCISFISEYKAGINELCCSFWFERIDVGVSVAATFLLLFPLLLLLLFVLRAMSQWENDDWAKFVQTRWVQHKTQKTTTKQQHSKRCKGQRSPQTQVCHWKIHKCRCSY